MCVNRAWVWKRDRGWQTELGRTSSHRY